MCDATSKRLLAGKDRARIRSRFNVRPIPFLLLGLDDNTAEDAERTLTWADQQP